VNTLGRPRPRLRLRVPVPLPRLAALAAVASVAVALLPLPTRLALLVVNAGVLAVGGIDAALAPRPASIPVERVFPRVASLGKRVEISWRIENGSPRSLWVELADLLAPSLRVARRRVRLKVPARGTATATTTIEPLRRGRFDVDELAVRVAGPLRLAARQSRRTAPHALRVYPPFTSRDEAELRITRARILEVGLRSAQGRGGGTEFDSLREYTADDEFRRVDWAATARTGRAIVRTYRAERNQNVLVLLDAGRVMAGRIAGVPRLDHAMDAVMMITSVTSRLGDRVGFVAFDADVRAVVPPARGAAQLARVTDAMYQLEPQLVESDYTQAFTTALGRFRRRALLIVFTDLAEQAVAETLLPALPLIARDHVVMIASVRDPNVVSWSRSTADDVEAAYRAAAAVASLEERRRLTARLRGMGVIVVDEPPGKLSPALADAYLKVKAAGRL
jgi:uncharacterized protein (DUF58 family)